MSKANKEAVDRLIVLTRSTITNDKIAAIEALGEAGGEQAVNRLVELTRSTITNDKITAIRALGRAGRLVE